MLPIAEEQAVDMVHGSLKLNETELAQHSMAIIANPDGAVVHATSDSRIATIGGERLAKRYIDWNFVSSRKDRIAQARADWQAGRFDKVLGDEDEFIPLPD